MDKLEPPKTIREIGIVLFYTNESLEKLTKTVEKQSGIYVSRDEHNDLKDRVKDLEDKGLKPAGGLLQAKEKLILGLAGLATAVSVALTAYFGGQ